MSENDLNNVQPITEPDLNAEPVIQPDLNAQAVTETDVLADGTDANKDVPYAKLKEATDARKDAEEKAAYAQRQLELMQMQQVQQPQTQPMSSMDQALKECGITQEELYGENMVRVMNRKDQLDRALMQQQNAVLSNQQFMASHPDVYQVLGSVNPTTGVVMTMSPELAGILTRKPHLQNACVSTQATYDIVMQDREITKLRSDQEAIKQHLTRQEVDNKTLPVGGSAAGGGGSGEPQQEKLMTREQVEEMQKRIDAGEI